MDNKDVALQELLRRVDAAGSQSAAARELGIPVSQINGVLKGRLDISKTMLDKLGFDKVVIHVRKQDRYKLIRAIEPAGVTFKQL